MSDERAFFLVSRAVRMRVSAFVLNEAPDEWGVFCRPPTMNDGQRQRFHATCNDIAKSGLQWAGKTWTAAQWKVLLISGHAAATGDEVEVVCGLEGEMVNVRESTTSMSRRRGASLITYATAFATMNGVRLNDPRLEEYDR